MSGVAVYAGGRALAILGPFFQSVNVRSRPASRGGVGGSVEETLADPTCCCGGGAVRRWGFVQPASVSWVRSLPRRQACHRPNGVKLCCGGDAGISIRTTLPWPWDPSSPDGGSPEMAPTSSRRRRLKKRRPPGPTGAATDRKPQRTWAASKNSRGSWRNCRRR